MQQETGYSVATESEGTYAEAGAVMLQEWLVRLLSD